MPELEATEYTGPERRNRQTNTELILYRLDGIDKKLLELQALVTQTALQEKRITDLEHELSSDNALREQYLLLKQDVAALRAHKNNTDAKWWQILMTALSPLLSAVVAFILIGGLKP